MSYYTYDKCNVYIQNRPDNEAAKFPEVTEYPPSTCI